MTITILTDANRAAFKSKMQADLVEKRARLIEFEAEVSELRENEQDPIDVASIVEQRTNKMAEIQRLQASIRSLEKALGSFDDDFGYCQACGEEIGVKRLEANPSVTTCITCQTAHEKKQKQFAS